MKDMLKKSEIILKAIINNGVQSIIFIDKHFRVQAFNKNADYEIQRVFGKEIEEGELITDFVLEEHKDCLYKLVDRALKLEFVRNECKIRGNNGLEYCYKLNLNPILSEKNEVIGICLLIFPMDNDKMRVNTIQRRLEFERSVSAISSYFTNILDINEAIYASLRELGLICRASRAYVFLLNKEENIINSTYEWCDRSIKSKIGGFNGVSLNLFPWLKDQLHKEEITYIENVATLPSEATFEKETWKSDNISSLIILPMRLQKEPIGFIGIDNPMEIEKCSEHDIILLKLISQIFCYNFERFIRGTSKKYQIDYKLKRTDLQAVAGNSVKKSDIERRQYFRVKPFTYICANMKIIKFKEKTIESPKSKVCVLDISAGGLKFLSNLKLPIGAELIIEFEMDILGKKVVVPGRIVRIEKMKEGIHQYGVQFIINENTRIIIIKLLNAMDASLQKNLTLNGCSFCKEEDYVKCLKLRNNL